jgi:pilus assembly protein CpaC
MDVRKRYDDYVNSGGDVKGPYGHIIAPDARLPAPVAPAAVSRPAGNALN